jgi:hypothetical protein
MIGKHLGAALRDELGLILHVLAAASDQKKCCETGRCENTHYCPLWSPTLSAKKCGKDGAPGFLGWWLRAES